MRAKGTTMAREAIGDVLADDVGRHSHAKLLMKKGLSQSASRRPWMVVALPAWGDLDGGVRRASPRPGWLTRAQIDHARRAEGRRESREKRPWRDVAHSFAPPVRLSNGPPCRSCGRLAGASRAFWMTVRDVVTPTLSVKRVDCPASARRRSTAWPCAQPRGAHAYFQTRRQDAPPKMLAAQRRHSNCVRNATVCI